MKIENAIERGFKKDVDGNWRKPTKRTKPNGEVFYVDIKYAIKICTECSCDFLASHAKNKFCSRRCSSINRDRIIPIGGYWLGKKKPYFPRKSVKSLRVKQHGYIWILVPAHPKANKKGYVAEHRYAMEQKLGRILESREVVHHINENKSDNRIENLLLMTRASHNSIHKSEEVKDRKRNQDGQFIPH